MNKKSFDLLKKAENSWWNVGRAKMLVQLISRYSTNTQLEILDYGAGFGALANTLSKIGTVDAYEPDLSARSALSNVYRLSTDNVGSLSKYDVICLCDVLEHIENDHQAILDIKRLLKPNGIIVITVPAYKFLWSQHDVSHMHFRRYTSQTLKNVIQNAGLKILFLSYWNTLLFPIVALMRLMGFTGESGLNLPTPANFIFKRLILAETFLIPKISYPFGLTVVSVAKL